LAVQKEQNIIEQYLRYYQTCLFYLLFLSKLDKHLIVYNLSPNYKQKEKPKQQPGETVSAGTLDGFLGDQLPL